MSSATPIDGENVKLTWCFTAPRSMGEDMAKLIADGFFQGVSQDLLIWENKIYEDKPLFLASERKMVEQRQWAAQFYSGME